MPRNTLLLVPLAAISLFGQTQRAAVDTPRTDNAVQPPAPQQVTTEMRADIMMARKMYREAIDFYAQCPESAVVTNKIGIAYHQMQDLKTAKKYYEKASKMNPQYAEAINNLGTVFYAQKSYRRAVKQYEKALEYSPDSASIYSNLGTAHFARKKYEDAVVAYQKALTLDPQVFERRSSSGVLLQERSVEERAKFHYYLAKLYAKNGNDEAALLYLRKALEEGWKDRAKIPEEPEFVKLRENAEFKEIVTREYKVL